MDLSINSAVEDDHSDSWSFIDENISEDGIDFEVVRDLYENNFNDAESASTDRDTDVGDLIEDNIEPTVTTLPTSDGGENFENANEEEIDVLVDYNPSNSSLKKFQFHKEETPNTDVEKNKLKKRKKRFYKCPFVTGVSLGTILTVCGLSLILKSSSKNIIDPKNSNVSTNSLNNSFSDEQSLWPFILEEENLLHKYCPNKFNKDWIKQKSMKSKLLKQFGRRIKQQIRDYDIKPSKDQTGKQQKNELIGPLNKNECPAQHNEEDKTHSELNFCKQRLFDDTFIHQANICPVQTNESNCTETSNDVKDNCENYSATNETEIKNGEALDEKNVIPGSELEESYHNLQNTLENYNYRNRTNEGRCTDIIEVLENKISKISLDNMVLTSLISDQEKLLENMQNKIAHKKKLYEKRVALQSTLEKHLQSIKQRRNSKNNILNNETDVPKKVSEQILDELLLSSIKNSSNTQKNSEPIVEKKYSHFSKIPLVEQKDSAKTRIEVILKKQKLLEEMSKKMEDEQHIKQINHHEKCDPKKSWIRKPNDFH